MTVQGADASPLQVQQSGLLIRVRVAGQQHGLHSGKMCIRDRLRQVSALLLDVHGQHEHQSLMDEKRHLDFLDGFAGEAIKADAERVAQLYGAWHKTRTELERLRRNEAERERRIDMLRYQIQELKSALSLIHIFAFTRRRFHGKIKDTTERL